MKYETGLTFAYYSTTFWDFKSHQGIQKPVSVKVKKYIFKKDVQISK